MLMVKLHLLIRILSSFLSHLFILFSKPIALVAFDNNYM